MSTSINDLTNNTSSTLNLTLEEMRQQSQQINENSTFVQDNINNATPIIPDALNLQQNNTTTKGLDILSGNGDTKANIDLPQRNTTSDQTQNNPALQQLRQQAQQLREIVENAPIISLDTPLFAGGSSSGTGSDLAEDIDEQSADATGEKNYSTTVNGRRPSIVLTKAPNPRKSVRNNNGDIIYNGKVNLKKISGISGDAADGSALGTIDYEKLILGYEDGTVKTAVADQGAVINLDWNGDERAEEYIGDNSGVDVDEYDGTVAINLNTGVGVLDGDEAIIIGGVDKLKAGSGAAMFVGSAYAPNTLMGGSGDSSIWGGGNSKDLLVGYSGSDKSGATNFFYVKGNGKDTISGFAYLTSENADTADEINFLENSVTKIHIVDDDVYLTVENDDDVLKVEGAVGKDFKVRNNNTAVIAQVNTDRLTYDGRANYFYATGKNATLTVDGSVQTAEIWLNGAKGEYYTGDIKVLDASQVEGRTTLVGNDYDNVIIASKGDSSMWGGNSSSNDTLIGGEGSDNFFYTYGNGNDSINNAADNDTVNLFDVNLEQISNVEANMSAIKINFTDGGSLTVNGDTSGLRYRLGNGDIYTVNQNTREWTKK